MRRIFTSFIPASMLLCLALITASGGCASASNRAPAASGANHPRAIPADFDQLLGTTWSGTLTYRDYSSNESVTIRSSLVVERVESDAGPSWAFQIGYADEPHANNSEVVSLVDDGRMINDETVVERTVVHDGVRLITERDGEDNKQPARLRYTYTLGMTQCSIQKEVRPAGETNFIQRNIYRWAR